MRYDNPMTSTELITDREVDECTTNHDAPRDDCQFCQVRKASQSCGICDASYEDGRWFTGIGSTTPNSCDHESLVDGFGAEVTCPALATLITRIPGFEGVRQICGSPVTTAGATYCTHHQRIVTAEECGRIYQNLVASR